ncbi:MAG: hypothetical protein JSV19_13450 [Phycisphaerales bacterium]|nr:MAG: hypothetical protein JSV19_13450 [Phycisphaerales bacterium]
MTCPTIDSQNRPAPQRRAATSLVATAFVVWAGCVADARAQEEKLPAGEAVLEKFIEVTGGRGAYEKIRNRKVEGSLEFMGVKGKRTAYEAAPNKRYVVMDMGEFGRQQQGTDGEVAWGLSDMQGPIVPEGEEKDVSIWSATFNFPLHWKKLYKKVECVGTETVRDQLCYKVVLTPTVGDSQTSYYAKETGLLLRTDTVIEGPMGAMSIEQYEENYKEVDGVLIAHKITQKFPMGTQVITVDSIENNVDMPKDRFDPPPEVRAQLKESKKSPKPAADKTPADAKKTKKQEQDSADKKTPGEKKPPDQRGGEDKKK